MPDGPAVLAGIPLPSPIVTQNGDLTYKGSLDPVSLSPSCRRPLCICICLPVLGVSSFSFPLGEILFILQGPAQM